MSVILQDGYWPDKPISEAPVWLQVCLDTEDVDRTGDIPSWHYAIQVKLADFRGIAQHESGCVEATSEERATSLVYLKVVAVLAELLAVRVQDAT